MDERSMLFVGIIIVVVTGALVWSSNRTPLIKQGDPPPVPRPNPRSPQAEIDQPILSWESSEEQTLARDLLTKVQGDHGTAERLIGYERARNPNGTRLELLRDANASWEHDNR